MATFYIVTKIENLLKVAGFKKLKISQTPFRAFNEI